MTLATGSQMDRIVLCPASAALPQVTNLYPEDRRDRGTAMHKFLERVGQVGREAALEEVEEQHRGFCERIEVASLTDRLSLTLECALAYDWVAETARVLVPSEHRAYDVDVTREIPLTIDVAGVGDRFVYAGDFKSQYAWLPAPDRSMQLGIAALALARLHRARRAQVEYMRVRDDGTTFRFSAHLDVFALEGIAEKVGATMRNVQRLRAEYEDGGIPPNVVEGEHCRYCPAFKLCPAKTALVRSVLAGDAKHKLSLREPITAENVGEVYAMLKKVREATKHVEAAIRAYEAGGDPSTPGNVSPTAIPAGIDADGSVRYFGRFERPGREEIDGDIALDVLRGKYGDAAMDAFDVATTKEAIRDVVRAAIAKGENCQTCDGSGRFDDGDEDGNPFVHPPCPTCHGVGKGKKIGAEFEAALDEIRKRGGAKRPPTDKPAEFTVSQDGAVKKATRKKAS